MFVDVNRRRDDFERHAAEVRSRRGVVRTHTMRDVPIFARPLAPAELESRLPHAYFPGHQSGDALARWYASADVFVFPSTTETLGNVVLEALASGVPAVVVDRGGPQDLIDPGVTGFVARGNDPEDIAARVEMLLRDGTLRTRMGEAARAAAADRDWSAINGRLIESYGRVIAR